MDFFVPQPLDRLDRTRSRMKLWWDLELENNSQMRKGMKTSVVSCKLQAEIIDGGRGQAREDFQFKSGLRTGPNSGRELIMLI